MFAQTYKNITQYDTKPQAGFTLLELLVVVAIMAILAGSVIFSFQNQEKLAGDASAVHAMASLQEGIRIYQVNTRNLLPSNLDSLLCGDTDDFNADGTLSAPPAIGTPDFLGGLSDVAGIGGGMLKSLQEKLVIEDVTSAAIITNLYTAGLEQLRYVQDTACDQADGDVIKAAGEDLSPPTTQITDTALGDVAKPNLIFSAPVYDDDFEWLYGAGASAPVTGSRLPIALFEEPLKLGEASNAVIAVFGIGLDSTLGDDILGQAPSDGNAGQDKYSRFLIAVKIAQCPSGTTIEDDLDLACDSANWQSIEVNRHDETVEIVSILAANGNDYKREIALARGRN